MADTKSKPKIALVNCPTTDRLDLESLETLVGEVHPTVFEDASTALNDAENNNHEIYLLGNLPDDHDCYKFLHQAKKSGCRSPIISLVNKKIEELSGDNPKGHRPPIDYFAINSVAAGDYEDELVRIVVNSVFSRNREDKVDLQSMFESMYLMFYVEKLEPEYSVEYLSPAWETLGYPREYWYYENRKLFRTIMHPEDHKMVKEANKKILEKERLESDYEYRVYTKDGEMRWWRDQGRVIFDEHGDRYKWFGVISDVTEKKNAELALSQSEEKYRNLIEHAHDIIFTHDLDGNIKSINQAVERITGFTKDEVLEMNLLDIVAPEDKFEVEEMIGKDFEGDGFRNYEIEILDKSGKRKSLEISNRLIEENGKATEVECIARDATARKESERKLEFNALHDSLTGLPNRKHFMKHLELAVERRRIERRFEFAVLFIDLDRFKIVNDSLGHYIGDKLLVKISEILKSCVRPSDIISRLGGDEFTILISIKHESDAIRVADRIQEKISVPFKIEGSEVFTSASVGIIIADEIDRDADEFLRDADTAMYRAKDAGKARYEIYDREMHKRNVNLLELETDLRKAITQNEFRAYYQPIVDLHSGEIKEFEALIRWEHPKRGLVNPDEFIDIAEETGLIVPIGNWMMQESCRQIVEWEKRLNRRLTVSVNLSTKQLMDTLLVDKVQKVLKEYGLTSDRLKLEITEHSVMGNTDFALKTIRDLNAIGLSVSIDDFGTGHSSLSYLHIFPFERIKIDRSFIWKMDTDAKSEGIVRSIMMLGRNLEIDVVAEGIESEEQLWQLRSLGCQYGQGYVFSKPTTPDISERLLESGLDMDFDEMELPFGFAELDSSPSIDIKSIQ